MYENSKLENSPVKQAEHLSLATKIANDIIEKFNPEQQNEMLRCIRQAISERRQLEIEKTEKELNHLKETFDTL